MGLYQCNSPDNRRKNFGLIHHVESWTHLICDKNDVCKKRIDALIIPICLSIVTLHQTVKGRAVEMIVRVSMRTIN